MRVHTLIEEELPASLCMGAHAASTFLKDIVPFVGLEFTAVHKELETFEKSVDHRM
jgi:hypothetical protein